MATNTTLSVRGEALRTVAPDYVLLQLRLQAVPASRAEVLAWLRAAQVDLIRTLTTLGGEPLTVSTERAVLTWSFGSLGVHDEHDLDEATGRHGPTGRVNGGTSCVLTLRRLDQLPEVGQVLGATDHLSIDGITWQVDHDNAAWAVVRADAVGVALAKARDYATALGGTVISVEHVADAGLLSGADHESGQLLTQRSYRGTSFSADQMGGEGIPTLDPVPQEIRAVVEARVIADVDPLLPA